MDKKKYNCVTLMMMSGDQFDINMPYLFTSYMCLILRIAEKLDVQSHQIVLFDRDYHKISFMNKIKIKDGDCYYVFIKEDTDDDYDNFYNEYAKSKHKEN